MPARLLVRNAADVVENFVRTGSHIGGGGLLSVFYGVLWVEKKCFGGRARDGALEDASVVWRRKVKYLHKILGTLRHPVTRAPPSVPRRSLLVTPSHCAGHGGVGKRRMRFVASRPLRNVHV